MTKNPITTGIILFIITMLIFFAVYYFFGNINYFDISLKVNSFVLPVIYGGTALYSVRSFWKSRTSVTFRDAFNKAFVPMFVGGFLSVSGIFLFLNFGDVEAKNLLNHQFVEKNKAELTSVYQKEKSRLKNEAQLADLEKDYQKSMQSFSMEQVKEKDMFTASHFSGYFAAILVFYLIISLFLGAFFRSKTEI
ncbi:MAG: DUF4199 domain-containing protein [Bergeyella sp.]